MKSKKVKVIIIVLVLIFILSLIILVGDKATATENNKNSFAIDINATNEEIKEMSDEEIEKILSNKVKEAEINMTMSSKIELSNGEEQALLLIENREVNTYPQIVEIKLKNTGETIYKSDLIPVGYRVDKSKLNKKLEKGEYKAIAYFSSYDEKKKVIVGTGGAEVDIVVKN